MSRPGVRPLPAMPANDEASGPSPLSLTPGVHVEDPVAARWLREVTLRLRREIAWLWHLRGGGALSAHGPSAAPGLPGYVDRVSEALDLVRFETDRRAFFEADPTAAWLGGLIRGGAAEATAAVGSAARGKGAAGSGGRRRGPGAARGFGHAADALSLDEAACFVLALALSAEVDAASAEVLAACANDPRRRGPTLALAQRLWDDPTEVASMASAGHPLVRSGLLSARGGAIEWDEPLRVAGPIARRLLFPGAADPDVEDVPRSPQAPAARDVDLAGARIRTRAREGLILPVSGAPGAPLHAAARAVGDALGVPTVRPRAGAPTDVATLRTLAWLDGAVLYLPASRLVSGSGPVGVPLPALPGVVVVGLDDAAALARLPAERTLPVLTLPPLDARARLHLWTAGLAPYADEAPLADAVADCARRFRMEAPAVAEACRVLHALPGTPEARDVEAVCRTHVDLGELARPVEPRFGLDDLVLPARQTEQVADLIRAAAALTRVHHEWGTARPWRESGLSALFAGPPGTGKTMAAEVVAAEAGMPLFRIDLSQVVNKYIGETEKNLRRLFDAADASDVVLFFDEADALFGKRTEVRDAHDRYANLEVSYLLERMERFRGLAILATNRRKDLDDAFLRRLRYVVEFPLPEEEERLRIWRSAIPGPVDASELDLPFLAARFPLSGGHIRSVVFQACLRSAYGGGPPRLGMEAVVKALRDELDKAGRAMSLEQFGPWSSHVRG